MGLSQCFYSWKKSFPSQAFELNDFVKTKDKNKKSGMIEKRGV